MAKVLVSGLVAAVLSLVGGVHARAADWGSFVIRNPTAGTLVYYVKWGNGPWERFSVAPACERFHAHRLNALGRAPRPCVRFTFASGGLEITKTFQMNFAAVNNPWNGLGSSFSWDRWGNLNLEP
jgi:hypothetical protein